MKYFWLGLTVSVILLTAGCDARTIIQNIKDKAAELRANYGQQFLSTKPCPKPATPVPADDEKDVKAKTCSNQDYTTARVATTTDYSDYGVLFTRVIGLSNDGYDKLARAVWWERCNANDFFKQRDSLPDYDLIRNVSECRDNVFPPIFDIGSDVIPSLPYFTNYIKAPGVPGNSHVTDYLALDSLAGLTCLEALYMPSKCAVYGANCESRYPYLGRSSVDLTPLTNLPNLKALDLSNYYIPDLTPLKALTNLEALSLYGVSTTTLAVGDPSKLQKLHIEPIGKLKKLTYLDVSHTATADFTPITGLTELRVLRANNTLIGQGFKQKMFLDKLKQLREIQIANTSVSNIAGLENLPELTRLNLSGTQVRELSPLIKMRNLRDLNLSNITYLLLEVYRPTNFPILSKLTNLTTLDLTGTSVSKGFCADLRKALRCTKIIGC